MKALVLVVIAACSHATSPAWPTPHPKWDGGESIAPQHTNPITVAAEAEVEDEPIPEEPAPVVVKPVAPPTPTAVVPVVKPASPEEPLNLEETVIEIDD